MVSPMKIWDEDTKAEGLAAENVPEEELEESIPNKESSSSLEIDPSLILHCTFFAFNFFI